MPGAAAASNARIDDSSRNTVQRRTTSPTTRTRKDATGERRADWAIDITAGARATGVATSTTNPSSRTAAAASWRRGAEVGSDGVLSCGDVERRRRVDANRTAREGRRRKESLIAGKHRIGIDRVDP